MNTRDSASMASESVNRVSKPGCTAGTAGRARPSRSAVALAACALLVPLAGCWELLGFQVGELGGGGDVAAYYDPYSGYSGGGYGGGYGYDDGSSYIHRGIGGGIGGDGETFYFIDGDSSYISGP